MWIVNVPHWNNTIAWSRICSMNFSPAIAYLRLLNARDQRSIACEYCIIWNYGIPVTVLVSTVPLYYYIPPYLQQPACIAAEVYGRPWEVASWKGTVGYGQIAVGKYMKKRLFINIYLWFRRGERSWPLAMREEDANEEKMRTNIYWTFVFFIFIQLSYVKVKLYVSNEFQKCQFFLLHWKYLSLYRFVLEINVKVSVI